MLRQRQQPSIEMIGLEKNIAKRTFKILKKDYGDMSLIHLDKFEEIWSMKHKSTGKYRALKIKRRIWGKAGELFIWHTLENDNVMPLIDQLHVSGYDISIMPYYSKTLNWYLVFPSSLEKKSFHLTKKWMEDVLKGLCYLHEQGLCYLNLRPINVHISNSKAVLGDLSYTDKAKYPVRNFGLALADRPPECYKMKEVSGQPLDIWSFGKLALSVWTKPSTEKGQKITNWESDVYPSIFDSLQSFDFEVTRKFPSTWISSEEKILAMNMIKACLTYKPEGRPDAQRLMQHPFWSLDWSYEQVDPIWKTRALWEDTDQIMCAERSTSAPKRDPLEVNLPVDASVNLDTGSTDKCENLDDVVRDVIAEGYEEKFEKAVESETTLNPESLTGAQQFESKLRKLPIDTPVDLNTESTYEWENSDQVVSDVTSERYDREFENPMEPETILTQGSVEDTLVPVDARPEDLGEGSVRCNEVPSLQHQAHSLALDVSDCNKFDKEKISEFDREEDEEGCPQDCDEAVLEAPQNDKIRSGGFERLRKWIQKKWTRLRNLDTARI